MADTDILRAKIQGEPSPGELSWAQRFTRRFTGTFWARGEPGEEILNLAPGINPGPEWRIVDRLEAARILQRLDFQLGRRREAPPAAAPAFAVPAPSTARAAAGAVARERRPSIVERAVERARRARAPRPPRAARQPRPPRTPRTPRIKGTKNGAQLWCYGLAQGLTLYPPPNARSFAEGYDPNVELKQPGLWTKATSIAQCTNSLCTGPFGPAFQRLVRRLFGEREPPIEAQPPRAQRRARARRRATLPDPIPVDGNPLPPPPGAGLHPVSECCPIWEYKYNLYPPPNRRGYPCGYDPNTMQPGLWRCLTAEEAATPPTFVGV